MRRWLQPATNHDVVAVGHDGVYQHPIDGFMLVGAHVSLSDGLKPDGKPLEARAGLIFDVDVDSAGVLKSPEVVYRDHQLIDCVFENAAYWNVRRHALRGLTRTVRVVVKGARREHGGYDSVHAGRAEYVDVTALDNSSQGWQIRLTNNRSDVHWVLPKSILFERFTGLENGKPQGAGRAGFTLSIKDLGPESDVEIVDPIIQTIRSRAVKVKKDGTVVADSFGAACVEFCRSLVWRGGYVRMRNADRDDVQLYDYSNKGSTRTGPQDIDVQGLELAAGCTLSVRLGDGDRINISGCTGGGQIKLMEFVGGTWRKKASGGLLPIKGGFST